MAAKRSIIQKARKQQEKNHSREDKKLGHVTVPITIDPTHLHNASAHWRGREMIYVEKTAKAPDL